MKKLGRTVLCLAALMVLGGCGGTENGRLSGQNKVETVINQQIAANDKNGEKQGTDVVSEAQEESTADSGGQALDVVAAGTKDEGSDTTAVGTKAEESKRAASVDVDLTQMNSDMIYSTVYQMVNDPGSFRGKCVKMKGQYSASWYDVTNQYYNFILIADAAACCSQGMEFVWGDGSHKREEYPEEGQDIELVGIFDTYDEVVDGNTATYCHLKDAEFIEVGR